MSDWTASLHGWLPRFAAFVAGSRPGRALAAGAAFTSLLTMFVLAGVAGATLSPEQKVTSYLGRADAIVEPGPQAAPFIPGVGVSQPKQQEGGTDAHPLGRASIPLELADNKVKAGIYFEGQWPHPGLDGRFNIDSGSPPKVAGECFRSSTVSPSASLPFGHRITFTGVVQSIFTPNEAVLICAPGTWASWRLTDTQRKLGQYGLTVSTFYTGSGASYAVQSAQANDPTVVAGERDRLVTAFAQQTPQQFLATALPMMGLPFVAGLALGGGLGGWALGTAERLYALGLPRRRLLVACSVAALFVTLGGSITGLALGMLAPHVWHAAFTVLQPGRVFGDAGVPADVLALIVLVTLAGTLCGMGIRVATKRWTPGRMRLSGVQTRREKALMMVAGLTISGAAALIEAVSSGRLWFMAAGAVLGGVAFACGAALLLPWLATRMQLASRPELLVAGRLIYDDSRRWGVNAAALTAFSAIIATTFVFVTSSAGATLRLEGSPVRSGVAAVTTQTAGGSPLPADVRREFCSDIKCSRDPLSVRVSWFSTGQVSGPIWTFASLADMKAVVGMLTPLEEQSALEGKVLSAQVARETTGRLSNHSTHARDTHLIPIASEQARGFGGVAGFALSSPSDPDPKISYDVYTGLTPRQDELADEWSLRSGYQGINVLAYSGEARASWPLWTSISLGGFALIVVVVACLSMRQEVRSLRPLWDSFVALGLSRGWLRAVILSLALTFAAVCSIMCAISLLFSIALLMANYSDKTFNLGVVPWPLVALFLGAIPAASALASTLMTRSPSAKL